MKKHLTFILFVFIVFVFSELPTMAQGIIIYHKDGTQTKYRYENIDSIVTYMKDEADGSSIVKDTGFLYIDIKPQLEYDKTTRAVNTSIYENKNNYTIEIFKDVTLLGTYPALKLFSTLPLELPQGEYTIKAFCGTEHAASRDEILLYGETTCVISAGNKTNATVTCKPQGTRLKVKFDESLKTFFYDYEISIEGIEALNGKSITWSEENTEPWYVKVQKGGEDVMCTITAKLKGEYIDDSIIGQTENYTFTFATNLKYNNAYLIDIDAHNGDSPSISVAVSNDTDKLGHGDVTIN